MPRNEFEDLIERYPSERSSIRRLAEALRSLKPQEEYTFDYLYDAVRPRSRESLALLLAELVNRGVIRKVVRVESPSRHGGIKDFDSVTDVHDEIYDWRADQNVRVTPQDIRLLYKAS